MSNKSILLTSFGILFIVILVSALTYIINFGTSWSGGNDIWGQFGDYFGGILNPIISALSLIALIYLTITIRDIEDRREKENRDHQQKLLRLEFRHDALKEFLQKLTEYESHFAIRGSGEDWLSDKTPNLNNSIIALVENYEHLFPNLKSSAGYLDFTDCLIKIAKGIIKRNDAFEKYTSSKLVFIANIQQYLIDDLNSRHVA